MKENDAKEMAKKREILNGYLEKHHLPQEILEKIDIHSFHTDNFVYKAMRIGNNVGDIFDIAMDITLLEVIAEKYSLKYDYTDYPEIHTKDISEEQLDTLVAAAKIFEDRNKKIKTEYESVILKNRKELKAQLNKIIS